MAIARANAGRRSFHKQVALVGLDKGHACADAFSFNEGAVSNRNAGHIGNAVAGAGFQPAGNFHPVTNTLTFFHSKLLLSIAERVDPVDE